MRGQRRVFAAIHSGPLLVFDNPAYPPTRVDTGLKTAALSAWRNTICIVSFGPPYQIECLEQDSLRELWRAELPNEVGGYGNLEQDAENVYVLGQGRTLAFDVATGKRVWANNEFRSFAPFQLLRGIVLASDVRTGLEWRDASSGEVIARLEKQNGSYARNAEIVGDNVLIEVGYFDNGGDGLRLVKFPDEVKQRLRVR